MNDRAEILRSMRNEYVADIEKGQYWENSDSRKSWTLYQEQTDGFRIALKTLPTKKVFWVIPLKQVA